jgi:hypothetical protein
MPCRIIPFAAVPASVVVVGVVVVGVSVELLEPPPHPVIVDKDVIIASVINDFFIIGLLFHSRDY